MIQNWIRISHAAQHYYIQPITLLELKYRQGYGRIEVHSFLLKGREERTLPARLEVLEMLEVEEDKWFGRFDDFPNVQWMRRLYPRVDYTQAPCTVAGTADGCYA